MSPCAPTAATTTPRARTNRQNRGEVDRHHDRGEHHQQPQPGARQQHQPREPGQQQRGGQGDQQQPQGEPRLAAEHPTLDLRGVGEQQDRQDDLDDVLGRLELDVEDEDRVRARGQRDPRRQHGQRHGHAEPRQPARDQRPAEQQQHDDDEREHRSPCGSPEFDGESRTSRGSS
ncbi:hypothetical protein [Pseudonocardia pini]|uniref:hypothetical protein n=1 Tax=Pseudonocardia pini TaxID=2758030 RepID=UPI0015F10087|nr:hypothetical protein [Pseudonocardia pini]